MPTQQSPKVVRLNDPANPIKLILQQADPGQQAAQPQPNQPTPPLQQPTPAQPAQPQTHDLPLSNLIPRLKAVIKATFAILFAKFNLTNIPHSADIAVEDLAKEAATAWAGFEAQCVTYMDVAAALDKGITNFPETKAKIIQRAADNNRKWASDYAETFRDWYVRSVSYVKGLTHRQNVVKEEQSKTADALAILKTKMAGASDAVIKVTNKVTLWALTLMTASPIVVMEAVIGIAALAGAIGWDNGLTVSFALSFLSITTGIYFADSLKIWLNWRDGYKRFSTRTNLRYGPQGRDKRSYEAVTGDSQVVKFNPLPGWVVVATIVLSLCFIATNAIVMGARVWAYIDRGEFDMVGVIAAAVIVIFSVTTFGLRLFKANGYLEDDLTELVRLESELTVLNIQLRQVTAEVNSEGFRQQLDSELTDFRSQYGEGITEGLSEPARFAAWFNNLKTPFLRWSAEFAEAFKNFRAAFVNENGIVDDFFMSLAAERHFLYTDDDLPRPNHFERVFDAIVIPSALLLNPSLVTKVTAFDPKIELPETKTTTEIETEVLKELEQLAQATAPAQQTAEQRIAAMGRRENVQLPNRARS